MSSFSDVRSIANKVFADNGGNPLDFVNLLQKLLSLTVLKPGEIIDHDLNPKKGLGIFGSRLGQTALRLNNDFYLKFFMYFRYGRNDPLTIIRSSFQYQIDDGRSFTDRFVFRCDYDVNPQDEEHPIAHLQINGLLNEQITQKKLEDIRFPLYRPSIESLLILLIDGFGLKSNDATGEWRKILLHSEDCFRMYQAKKLVKFSPK